ncbi:uncharacterized protein BYT42DRAFT_611370 [Radiomyces spectabilis]|uniref:uncharacterized protein n=1 Tax=Radiomyces spectabilis TaxID=64574 RepID=UPI00221E74C2|nr:uncharacterized protein BYT42DRAFT_611370 [Radiomyces spectabilis]KAI8388309.1 hypothetical protein BYT42DRAFT_611370 [Radiomyces spectabilis]
MKAALFFLVLCLAYTASAISVWCNYKKGNSDDCILPGVGPTYDCGKSAGLSGYQSGTNQKYWAPAAVKQYDIQYRAVDGNLGPF